MCNKYQRFINQQISNLGFDKPANEFESELTHRNK